MVFSKKNPFFQFKLQYNSSLKGLSSRLKKNEAFDDAFHIDNLIRIIDSLAINPDGSHVKIPYEQCPSWDNNIFFYIDTTNENTQEILGKHSPPALKDYKNKLFNKMQKLATTLGEEKDKNCRLGNP